jgi:hypothetical protein
MALNATTLASDMLTAYSNAGKLVGMDTPAQNKLKADWEFMFNLLFTHIKNNAVVSTTLDSGLNTVFSSGVAVPQDGGTALQTAWKAATTAGAKDDATGTIS